MPLNRVPLSSLSSFAQAIAGGNNAYQNSYDTESKGQSTLAQAIASARLNNAKAGNEELQLAASQPDKIRENALTGLGIPTNAGDDFQEFIKTGKLARTVPLPADQQGPVEAAPDYLKKLPQAGRIVMALQNALALGDKNSLNVAKATGDFRDQSLEDQVLDNTMTPLALAQAKYASKGSAPYHFSEFGVGNNLTGTVDDSGAPAQRFGTYRTAQTGQANAAAAHSLAGRDKILQDIELGGKGTLRDTDQGVVLVDPRTGTSKPVLGQDGNPLGPKLKDVPTQANTAIISNKQQLSKINNALTLLGAGEEGETVPGRTIDNEATGWKGMLPGAVVNRLDPKGVDARAEIADIGSLVLHDRSGAAITASESPRLVPFIPLPSDDNATAVKKLKRFKQIYQQEQDSLLETYGPTNGYKQNPAFSGGKNVKVSY